MSSRAPTKFLTQTLNVCVLKITEIVKCSLKKYDCEIHFQCNCFQLQSTTDAVKQLLQATVTLQMLCRVKKGGNVIWRFDFCEKKNDYVLMDCFYSHYYKISYYTKN